MSGNGIEAQRLMQAIEHFKARTRGAALPEGVEKALGGLSEALGTPMPDRDTPGGREALKVAPGTRGTGEPFSKAVLGPDGPSPGQRAAKGASQEIDEAATGLAAKIAS